MIRLLLEIDIDPGGAALIVIVLMLFTVGIGVLLFFSAKREHVRYKDITSKQRIFNGKEAMDSSITETINVAGSKTKFYLFRIDINDYDQLVKSYGEEQSVNVINTLIALLDAHLTAGTRLCRYSDDQVLVIMRDFANFSMEKYALVLLELAKRRINVDKVLTCELDVNIGVVAYPEGGKTLDDLMQSLDVATVVSKRMGVNKTAVYSTSLTEGEKGEYKFYTEIKNAMARKEFTLHYQPIISLENYEVVGAECLIRWEHATNGIISPGKFLPIMERTGDINWVGVWSFEQMVKQQMEWQARYEQRFWLSINMSIRQIADPELVPEFKRILKKYHADARDYCIEIFDIGMYERSDAFRDTIDKLKSAGFNIAIDKYGRDFSGLTQLEKMPITQIKLDNLFLEKSKESSMTGSVVDAVSEFCKERGIVLIADGVETEDDVAYAKEKGINVAQGFYYSKPKDKKEFIGEVLLTPWKD